MGNTHSVNQFRVRIIQARGTLNYPEPGNTIAGRIIAICRNHLRTDFYGLHYLPSISLNHYMWRPGTYQHGYNYNYKLFRPCLS